MIAKALPAQVHMLRDKTLNFCEASFHGILQAHQLCSLHRPSLNRKLAVLQSLPSCSDLVVEMTWYEMLWNVQHVRHQRQGGLNILNDFFFFPRLPWTRGEKFQFLRRCEALDQPSWELPWWLVCWWHLMPKMPLGSSELQWSIFFGYAPKKRLVSPSPRLPKFAKI